MNMKNMFNGMFGPVSGNCCKLSMDGRMAVKTKDGSYKYYNADTGRLVNCDSMVLDLGEVFYIVPTNNVQPGDVIMANGTPKFVKEIVNENEIKVINYDGSTIESIIPERHMFMGNVYFYGKIVSMFGQDLFKNGDGAKNVMQYAMMSQMMNGSNGNQMNPMMMYMMMNNGNGFGNIFENMFNFGDKGDAE